MTETVFQSQCWMYFLNLGTLSSKLSNKGNTVLDDVSYHHTKCHNWSKLQEVCCIWTFHVVVSCGNWAKWQTVGNIAANSWLCELLQSHIFLEGTMTTSLGSVLWFFVCVLDRLVPNRRVWWHSEFLLFIMVAVSLQTKYNRLILSTESLNPCSL